MEKESIQIFEEILEAGKNLEVSWYLILKNHPEYNFLRSHPRFQEILAKQKEIYEENLEKYGDIDI